MHSPTQSLKGGSILLYFSNFRSTSGTYWTLEKSPAEIRPLINTQNVGKNLQKTCCIITSLVVYHQLRKGKQEHIPPTKLNR